MKTTVDIPDGLFRQTKATAALRGETFKDFVTAALQAHLSQQSSEVPERSGWRSVFGEARREEVEEIDAIVVQEFERIEPGDWT